MGDVSAIEWCDSTFNPWVGCTKVSPACDNCYAETLMSTRLGRVSWGAGKPRMRTSPANWRKPLQWNAQRFTWCAVCGYRGVSSETNKSGQPLCPQCWQITSPVRRRVFCASLADVFDNEVDPQWRSDLLDLIDATPNLDWLILTKRIGNVLPMLTDLRDSETSDHRWSRLNDWITGRQPPANVWLGATIADQSEADRDIAKIVKTPASVIFVSIEPMLGPINLRSIQLSGGVFDALVGGQVAQGNDVQQWRPLDWVIAGGESGANARPMHPDWVTGLRDQCAATGVPFLFKQWGEWAHPDQIGWDTPAVVRAQWEYERNGRGDRVYLFHDAAMAKVGKRVAGRLLDGVEHNGFPLAAAN